MTRLQRLYNRMRIDEMELNILRGMLTETQKVVFERSALRAKLNQKTDDDE
jgi:tRNA (cytidine32/uridine32-2'-O)-methyltransferase